MLTNLKELREAKDWSIEDLASKMEVSVRTVFRWETGRSKPIRAFQKKLNRLFKIEGK